MNHEGYKDDTADTAVAHASRTPDHVMDIVYAMRSIASLAGYEIIGRVALRDKATGKEYR